MKRLTLIAVVLACLSMVAVADEPRVLSDYLKMPENVGVPVGNAALPLQALSEQCVDRWAHILDMSEAQAHFMELHYRRFVERHNEFMDREVMDYVAESSALNAMMVSGTRSPDFVDSINDLRARSNRLCLALERIEHDFVEAIVPVLTEQQLDRVEMLRLEGTRRAHRTFLNNVRWADIELRQILEGIEVDISLPDEARLQEILAEYEAELTPLVRAQAEAFWDRPGKIIPLLIRYDNGLLSDSGFQSAYRHVHRRNLNAGRAIRRLTQLTLIRLNEAPPATIADALEREVKQHVYPEVYPDRSALHALFKAVLNHDDLDDEHAAEVEVLFTDYLERHSRLCDDLEQLCLEWSDGGAAGDPNYHDADLPAALAPLLEQRRELSRDTLQLLRELIGEELVDEIVQVAARSRR